MLDVVTFKWQAQEGFRTKFTAEHVNILYAMVRRHYADPFRFTAITDDAAGIRPEIRIIPLWKDFASLPSPHGPRHPACYRRIKIFSPEAAELIGERILCLDLDVVITGDMRPVWNRPEPVVFFKGQWGSVGRPNGRQPYNGSMFLLTAGARPDVWRRFNKKTPYLTRRAGFGGSDQAWYALALGPNEAVWDERQGVYSFRNQIATRQNRLPSNARIVLFHGRRDPWDSECQSVDWVRKHYAP